VTLGPGHPDHLPHWRYTVTLRDIDGATKDVRVITNRGEAKAVYLAVARSSRLLGGRGALDVDVRNDGAPELDLNGVAILRGYAFDRREW
jgi:hypothetical protein